MQHMRYQCLGFEIEQCAFCYLLKVANQDRQNTLSQQKLGSLQLTIHSQVRCAFLDPCCFSIICTHNIQLVIVEGRYPRDAT